MENTKKREKTIYDDSLSGIFFRSGLMMLVMLLIACVAIGAVVLFAGGSDSREGIKLIFFWIWKITNVPCRCMKRH